MNSSPCRCHAGTLPFIIIALLLFFIFYLVLQHERAHEKRQPPLEQPSQQVAGLKTPQAPVVVTGGIVSTHGGAVYGTPVA